MTTTVVVLVVFLTLVALLVFAKLRGKKEEKTQQPFFLDGDATQGILKKTKENLEKLDQHRRSKPVPQAAVLGFCASQGFMFGEIAEYKNHRVLKPKRAILVNARKKGSKVLARLKNKHGQLFERDLQLCRPA